LSGVLTGKAGAMLILVISVSLFQVAAFLIQPRSSSLGNILGNTGNEKSTASVGLTSQNSPTNQTVTVATTVLTTVPTTLVKTVSVTNTTTVLSSPPQDYSPFGIATVVAVAMIALVVMFMRRQR
jgi:cobalamin synthase